MNKNQRFFICKHCGNILGMIKDSGVPVSCCGEEMAELVPNTVDASREKHVPAITITNNLVTVAIGSAPHPMTEQHFIEWVYLLTDKGGHRKFLSPGNEPKLEFALTDDEKAIAAFAYCNLHSLWKAEA